jgi:sugar lactone lactonase YvrE
MRKAVVFLLTAIFALSLIGMPRAIVRAQDAAPTLDRVRPDKITAGAPTFTVRLDGKRFASGAKVLFDGVALASSRISRKGKFLLAEVDAALVATPGEHTVAGQNPDGMTTPSLPLSVLAADSDAFIRLPQNAVEEDSGSTFVPFVEGSGLSNTDKVFVWGKSVDFLVVSDRKIQILIPGDFVDDPARIPVNVRDKDGHRTNTEIFFVVPRPASINNLDPDSLTVGTEDVLLKVFGNFKENAVIVVNGIPLATTPVKRRLEAMIPASLLAQPTQLIVRLEQDGIQSNDVILPVTPTDAPFIFTIGPTRVRLGDGRESIEIIGANFDNQTTATVDGQDAKVKNVGKRHLTVIVRSDTLSVLGPHTVQVKDKDGNPTNTVTFTVVPDVIVSTLAGNGNLGFNTATCVSGTDAMFRRPRRLALGPDGLLYVTDQQNHAIRTVNADSGEVCTIAGGEEGYKDSADSTDPPAFSFPNGITVAGDGTIFVTENGNNVVRRIRRNGSSLVVDTFAGMFDMITNPDKQAQLNSTRAGVDGFHNGSLLEATFSLPDDILIAPDGTIYLADAGNHAIRRIRQNVVDTLAGNGVPGFADGVAENARFNTPTGLALSPDARFLYVADTNNHRVRRIDLLTQQVGTIAGNGAADYLDGPGGEASFNQPIGLAVDTDGSVYVSEILNNTIRLIDTLGNVTTVAGSKSKFEDGPGLTAKFDNPRGLALDRQRGILYVADQENSRIRKIVLR